MIGHKLCINIFEQTQNERYDLYVCIFTVISQYCAKARDIFEEVRKQYARLAEVVPKDQYYRFHDQWRFVTQRLCFLASLVVYLEVKVLVTKETVASILGGNADM